MSFGLALLGAGSGRGKLLKKDLEFLPCSVRIAEAKDRLEILERSTLNQDLFDRASPI
ncbi:MAG: hypothetical protein WGN25_05050 [Candidatus Electrothrix sp. GW3-4]|uniref:hypothetical protein n=1 Tax=Candidatus Electrothrix sp. GW3-4 TaxID=3126740 RepID=UPI0030D21936